MPTVVWPYRGPFPRLLPASRKGMSEDVTIHKFFDDPMLLELARQVRAAAPYLTAILLELARQELILLIGQGDL